MSDQSRTVAFSATEKVVKNYAFEMNSKGLVFGGKALLMADLLAGEVAEKHSGQKALTLCCLGFRFFNKASFIDRLIFKASVNRVWGSSLEVGIKVIAKNRRTGIETHYASGYFILVTVDESLGSALCRYKVRLVTVAEKRRYNEADKRKKFSQSLIPAK